MKKPALNFSRPLFVAIIAAYSLYAALYIWGTSFVIDGQRYFCLFDDEMISMRYAKNLAAGHGLVWNPGGERVEGYTNPLWTLYMAVFHLFPIPLAKTSLVIQVTGAIFLLLNLLLVRRVAFLAGNGSAFVALSSVFLTAFYISLLTWGLQGTEVSVLAVVMSYAAWKGLDTLRNGTFTPLLYVILALATLVRIDMAVPFLGIGAFLTLADRRNRLKHLIWGGSTFAVFLLAQTAFRFLYYGDLLPNTYYLKVAGFPTLFRMLRGFHVFSVFAARMNPLIFILPLVLFLFRRDVYVTFLLWCFAIQVGYSIYVGGDAWETFGGSNRYISIAMPLFLVLMSCSLEEIRLAAVRRVPKWRRHLEAVSRPLFAVLAIVICVCVNRINPHGAFREWLLGERPALLTGNRNNVEEAFLIDRITTADAKVAIVQAGTTPYFLDRSMVDLLGKSDKVVARGKGRIPQAIVKHMGFTPGHQKWDYDHSIGRCKPDVIVQLWGDRGEANGYLVDSYSSVRIADFPLFVRRDSPNVLWDRLERLAGHNAIRPVEELESPHRLPPRIRAGVPRPPR